MNAFTYGGNTSAFVLARKQILEKLAKNRSSIEGLPHFDDRRSTIKRSHTSGIVGHGED